MHIQQRMHTPYFGCKAIKLSKLKRRTVKTPCETPVRMISYYYEVNMNVSIFFFLNSAWR